MLTFHIEHSLREVIIFILQKVLFVMVSLYSCLVDFTAVGIAISLRGQINSYFPSIVINIPLVLADVIIPIGLL